MAVLLKSVRGMQQIITRIPPGDRTMMETCKRSFSEKVYVHKLSPTQFEYHNCPEIDLDVKITKGELLKGYKNLNLVRNVELICDQLYKERLIRGFCHLSIGQEAVSAGISMGSNPSDSVITSYRCHGIALFNGVSPHSLFSELMGRKAGCSKGKGGSMHIYGPNFYGGNGIVGAQVPLGAGIAFANKYLKNGKATYTLYGDGAANQGQVYEAFNMAKLWKLPCVFICENNVYGMGTSTKRSSADTNYYNKCSYIPGIKVDALDLLAFKKVIEFSRDYVTSGNGPLIIEAFTYRYVGHSMSDPGTSYRERQEISDIRKKRDVILKLKENILALNAATEEELNEIQKTTNAEVKKAKDKAIKEAFPDLSELTNDVYADPKIKYRLSVIE